MTPELGVFALILAFCLSLSQSFFGLVGAWRDKPAWMSVARPAAASAKAHPAFRRRASARRMTSASISREAVGGRAGIMGTPRSGFGMETLTG